MDYASFTSIDIMNLKNSVHPTIEEAYISLVRYRETRDSVFALNFIHYYMKVFANTFVSSALYENQFARCVPYALAGMEYVLNHYDYKKYLKDNLYNYVKRNTVFRVNDAKKDYFRKDYLMINNDVFTRLCKYVSKKELYYFFDTYSTRHETREILKTCNIDEKTSEMIIDAIEAEKAKNDFETIEYTDDIDENYPEYVEQYYEEMEYLENIEEMVDRFVNDTIDLFMNETQARYLKEYLSFNRSDLEGKAQFRKEHNFTIWYLPYLYTTYMSRLYTSITLFNKMKNYYLQGDYKYE